MRMNSAITTLVAEELEEEFKWRGTVAAANGFIYGIPDTGRVAKFNPIDTSIAHIGPDFGDITFKWTTGAMADNGIIYCPPSHEDRGILKIDTNTDNVTELNVNLLPEKGNDLWITCAVALDGCIYFMPHNAHRIMKLDPNNGDAMSSVGDDMGDRIFKYVGTAIGIDRCVYGMPDLYSRIVKYDPINDITSFVGEKSHAEFECEGNGVLGRDGCIYAAVRCGRVLKIDTTNNSHCMVGMRRFEKELEHYGWGDAILGIDGCIYFPPNNATHILKYDPHSNQRSLVGDDVGREECKWYGGALATDGIIYCMPSCSKQVLAIDPMGEFEGTTETNMQECPEEFGSLFQTIEADSDDSDYDPNGDEDEDDDSVLSEESKSLSQPIEVDEDSIPSLTNFDLAVIKFGQKQVFEILEKYMKPIYDYCQNSNLCPFMLVASQKDSALCAIHHLLRRDLSWVNECIEVSLEGKSMNDKKRKYNTHSL